MEKIFKYMGRFLILSILIMLSAVLILAFADVISQIKEKIVEPPFLLVDSQGLIELFSLFLVILIGIELIETVRAYLKDDVVHVELVILVAIIAVARKVIVWDFEKHTHIEFITLALMVVALGITYFLVRQAGRKFRIGIGRKSGRKEKETEN